MSDEKKKETPPKCKKCGRFLGQGEWVGESHWDCEIVHKCHNPRCRTQPKEQDHE